MTSLANLGKELGNGNSGVTSAAVLCIDIPSSSLHACGSYPSRCTCPSTPSLQPHRTAPPLVQPAASLANFNRL